MKYKVSIEGWGWELLGRKLNKDMMECLENDYNLCFNEYIEDCYNGIVEEKNRLVNEFSDWTDDYENQILGEVGANYGSATITITDEEGNEVYSSDLDDISDELEDVDLMESNQDAEAVAVCASNEKNYPFFEGEFECEEFDEEKLSATGTIYKLGDEEFWTVTGLKYDDEDVEMEYVGGNVKGEDYYVEYKDEEED